MAKIELKPCPFCGADMSYVMFITDKRWVPTWKGISCKMCYAVMGADMNAIDEQSEVALQDYIIEKWNRRADNCK